jgi:hypothetical protein
MHEPDLGLYEPFPYLGVCGHRAPQVRADGGLLWFGVV